MELSIKRVFRTYAIKYGTIVLNVLTTIFTFFLSQSLYAGYVLKYDTKSLTELNTKAAKIWNHLLSCSNNQTQVARERIINFNFKDCTSTEVLNEDITKSLKRLTENILLLLVNLQGISTPDKLDSSPERLHPLLVQLVINYFSLIVNIIEKKTSFFLSSPQSSRRFNDMSLLLTASTYNIFLDENQSSSDDKFTLFIQAYHFLNYFAYAIKGDSCTPETSNLGLFPEETALFLFSNKSAIRFNPDTFLVNTACDFVTITIKSLSSRKEKAKPIQPEIFSKFRDFFFHLYGISEAIEPNVLWNNIFESALKSTPK